MKVFIEISQFASRSSAKELRSYVRQLEDLGAAGVIVWDHIFTSPHKGTTELFRPSDPMTTLAAVAGISDSLEVEAIVINCAWINPALLLRQWLQLAVFMGGERVTAGLGLGWNTEEFTAIGERMAPFRDRVQRLEETFNIGRQLFDNGLANLAGEQVSARDLPASPLPSRPPKLLVGGGSERIIRIGGTYCDVVDLHGSSKHGALQGKDFLAKHKATDHAIAMTSVDDAAEQVRAIRQASVAAGRPASAVEISTMLEQLIFVGGESKKREVEERLCEEWGSMPYKSLDEAPAALIGDARHMADLLHERSERYDLSRIAVKERADQMRFLREVVPLL